MAKRKLTQKVKDHLYANRWRVKQTDYTGEALAYLVRLRAASKAAKKRKDNTAKVGGVVIPRNSELYETIEASARIKRQSVSTFIKQNQEAIEQLMQDGRVVLTRETDYAISDINKLPSSRKIFINDQEVSKGDAIYALQSFTSAAMQYTDTVVINYELSYDLTGNLFLDLPSEEQITQAEEDADNGDYETFFDMLESAEGLVAIQSSKEKRA
jgi:hypothetical protein